MIFLSQNRLLPIAAPRSRVLSRQSAKILTDNVFFGCIIDPKNVYGGLGTKNFSTAGLGSIFTDSAS